MTQMLMDFNAKKKYEAFEKYINYNIHKLMVKGNNKKKRMQKLTPHMEKIKKELTAVYRDVISGVESIDTLEYNISKILLTDWIMFQRFMAHKINPDGITKEDSYTNMGINVISKSFAYGHVLPFHEGKCRYNHGHNGRLVVSVHVRDNTFLSTGNPYIYDFKKLKKVINNVIDEFDHQYIFPANSMSNWYIDQSGEERFEVDYTYDDGTKRGQVDMDIDNIKLIPNFRHLDNPNFELYSTTEYTLDYIMMLLSTKLLDLPETLNYGRIRLNLGLHESEETFISMSCVLDNHGKSIPK